MSYYNWQHQFLRRFLVTKPHGLTGLYVSNALRDVGLATVNIFVPIYLYTTFGSISAVFLFLVLYHATVLLSTYSIAKVISAIGLDCSGFIGGLLHAVFFFVMIIGRTHPNWIWLAAVFWGLSIPFTWLTHHYYLVANVGKKHEFGHSVSLFYFWDRWLLTLIPLAGGILLDLGGFDITYGLSMFFLGISGIPLFFDAFDKRHINIELKDTFFGLFNRTKARTSLALLCAGMTSEVIATAWVIYLFTVVKNYTKIGLVQTGSLFLSSLVLIWIGRQVDRKNKNMLHPAVIANTLNVLARGVVTSGLGLFFMQSLYQLVGLFIWIPFDARIYENAIKEKRMEFFVRRQWLLHVGGLIASIVLAVALSTNISWPVVFGFGAMALLAVGVIKL